MTQSAGTFYCSECSRAAGEQLFGTAPRADVWILLEYDGVWGAKTPDDSDLSPAIKTHIASWTAAIPNAKFSFIRQKGRDGESIRLYVARIQELSPELYRLDLNDYADLLHVDMAALALGDAAIVEHLTDEQLFVVCVNGKKDIACARFGTPVYESLREIAPSNTWASTHIGGHRFAATLASLPDGMVYGFIDPDDAPALAETMWAGQVRLDKARGRMCYPDAVQAAAYFLRSAQHIAELPGLRYISSSAGPDETQQVRLEVLRSGIAMQVTLKREMSAFDVFKDSAGPGAPVPQFALVAITPVI